MKKGLATICLILAILFALGTIGLITSDPAAALFGLICTVICVLLWRKLCKPKQPKEASDRPVSPDYSAPTPYTHIHIRAAGVTYRNDDGTDRQQLLRKIKFGDAPFEDNAHLDVQLQSYRYEGQPAIRVMVNGYQIGNVPKDQVAEVQQALQQPGAAITAFDVKGGGTVNGEKLSYGALIVVRYNK